MSRRFHPTPVARMHHMMNWLNRITTDAHRTIAANIGGSVSHTTIARAAASDTPPAHLVVDIARAYGINPVQALQWAGLLTPEEAQPYLPASSLRAVPSLVLLQELAHREAEQVDE